MAQRFLSQPILLHILAIINWGTRILGIAVILTLIVISTLLGSEWGRVWLTYSMVDKINHSSPLHIEIDGLSAPQLGHWTAASITASQDQRPWIKIDELDLQWRPQALLARDIVIEQIRADSLSLHNLPSDSQADKESADSSFNLLFEPVSVQLKKLTTPSLNLYDFFPATGGKNKLVYAIHANANWVRNADLELNIEARGLDANPATISLQAQSNDWIHAKFAGSLQEGAGGFFGELLQLPKQQAIRANFDVDVTNLDDRYAIKLRSLSFPLVKRALLVQGDMSVSLEKKAVHIDDLTFTIDNTRHSVIGTWIDQQLDFDVNLNNFPLDITSVWQDSIIGGQLTTELKISGTIAHPQARGKLSLNTEYKKLPIAVDIAGSISKSLLNIDNLQVQLAQSDVRAKGTVDLEKNTATLTASAANVDVNSLKIFNIHLPDSLKVIVTSAEATLHGPIKDPRGELLLLAKGSYEQQPFSMESRLTKDQTSVFIRQTTLTVADGTISLHGHLQPQTLDSTISIDAQSLSINALKLAGIDLPDTLEAKISTQLNMSGDLRNPTVAGDAQLKGVYQKIPFVLNAKGHHQSDDSQLEILNVFAFDEQVLTASGDYQQGQFDVRAQAQKLPTQLFSAFGWYVQPGKFNADIRAQGSLKDPALNGQLSYETVFDGYNDEGEQEKINFTWDLDINTSVDALHFASTFTRDKHLPGRLLLKIDTQPYVHYAFEQQHSSAFQNLPLKASIEGKFNLQTASFLLDPDLHRLTGDLNTDITIGGTLANPSVNGSLHIDKARYENPITGTLVDNIDCRLAAKQITLSVDNCQATDGFKGQYALSGSVQLPVDNTFGSVALKLQTRNANILRRPDIESEATGEITLSGDFASLLAAGSLEVAPFTANLDANLSSGIASINVEEIESQPESGQPIKKNALALPELQFDLVITASQQAYLRGHGLEAELQGQIDIHGNAKKPLYEGEFKTVHGVFVVFNKKFNLQRGQVNFANNAIGLAITGVYEKNGQRILSEISGTNDDIKLSFSSIPEIPEDEILAFLIFGKPIQTITPFEAVQLASAIQTLRSGGNGAFDPIGKTRDMLGIDTLSIESAETEDGSSINIGIGKYINEKVYLELERTPNPSRPWKGSLEIELTPNISLKSSTGGQAGIEGVELKWNHDY